MVAMESLHFILVTEHLLVAAAVVSVLVPVFPVVMLLAAGAAVWVEMVPLLTTVTAAMEPRTKAAAVAVRDAHRFQAVGILDKADKAEVAL